MRRERESYIDFNAHSAADFGYSRLQVSYTYAPILLPLRTYSVYNYV